MHRILTAALPTDLSAALQQALPSAVVNNVGTAAEALQAMADSRYHALVVHAAVADQVVPPLRSGLRDLRILVCGSSNGQWSHDEHTSCLQGFAPLEIARHLTQMLDIPLPAKVAQADDYSPIAATVWKRCKDTVLGRVAVVERASMSLLRGKLKDEQRRQAQETALQLAESIGSFGFMRASNAAREMATMLAGSHSLQTAEALRLSEWVVALRGELQAGPGAAALARSREQAPIMLIVDGNHEFTQYVARGAATHQVRVHIAESVEQGRIFLSGRRPQLALVDLAVSKNRADVLALISDLSEGSPAIQVMVLGERSFDDRLQASRHGASVYLEKPQLATQVWDSAGRLLGRLRESERRVMVVDDDAETVSSLRFLLEPRGIHVSEVSDPRQFWERLEEASPDLLLLSATLPHTSGLDLCRIVRADSRWGRLPVLCMTHDVGARNMQKIFAAGADDFLKKPPLGPEVLARIESGLERVLLRRSMSDTDALTGLANRAAATRTMERYLRLAGRNGHPYCVVMLNVDHLRDINAQHRYGSGDSVLRFLGRLLLRFFRGEDVVGRWSGEEFVLGLYGMTRQDGVHRLTLALDTFRAETFRDAEEATFQCSFSVGVAEHPSDGNNLESLCLAADEALAEAKAGGRNRVQQYRPQRSKSAAAKDVVLVTANESMAQAVLRAVAASGYHTQWMRYGSEAMAAMGGGQSGEGARVLLVDDTLPDGTGAELINNLKERHLPSSTHVFLLASKKSKHKSEQREIIKPVQTDDLLAAIRGALEPSS